MVAKPNFIERNNLIPLNELESSPFKPDSFSLASWQTQLTDEGLSQDDFYFNPQNKELPFCYYRGSVFLEFNPVNNNIAEIKSIIGRINNDINESVAKRNFDRFFGLIDKRLAPELYIEVFNFIPDQDKYRLFERLWKHNENSHEVFTASFIKKVSKYKGVTSERPVTDAAGYALVYLNSDTAEILPEQVTTWTADVNIAIRNALLSDPAAKIYRGRIHLNHILSYNNDIKELKVNPHQVLHIKPMQLIDFFAIENDLITFGIIDEYNYYSRQIDESWFNNPQGIHAVSHTKRVLLLSLIISYLEKYHEKDRSLLCLAAIYHDIGRNNDGYDPDHGMASYDKIISNKLIAADKYPELGILRFIVENHAIPDQSAYKYLNRYSLSDVDRTLRLYDAFKDADGLDRVRIRDLNPEYLRTGSAKRLLLAAHQLYTQKIHYL
ncbi:MAG: HD domain-containing protein [Syntrophomonas sp.]|nr:HD domain-containing protein [Syntrophomonas sp.]